MKRENAPEMTHRHGNMVSTLFWGKQQGRVRNGKLVYEADAENIRSAQNQLTDARYNKTTGELQDQIDEINRVADDQVEALDDMIEPLEDEVDRLDDLIEERDDLIEGLEDQIKEYTKQIDYIDRYLIEPLQDQVDAYDKELKALDYQIEPLQDQMKAYDDQIDYIDRYLIEPLQDQIDAYDKQVKALDYKIEPLQDQQKAYDKEIDAIDKEIEKYDDQIKILDNQIEALDDKIKINDELQKKWEKIQSDTEYLLQLTKAAGIAGMSTDEFENRVTTGNDAALYEAIKSSYSDLAKQQSEAADYSATLDTMVSLLERINDLYMKEEITAEKANELTKQIVDMAKDGFEGKEIYDATLAVEQEKNVTSAINDVKGSIDGTYDGMKEALEQAESNNSVINKHALKIEELEEEIADEIRKSKVAYSNAQDAEDSTDYYGGSDGGTARSHAIMNSAGGPSIYFPTEEARANYNKAAGTNYNDSNSVVGSASTNLYTGSGKDLVSDGYKASSSDSSSGPGVSISTKSSGGGSTAVASGGGNATVNNTTVNNSSSSSSSGGPGIGIKSSDGGGGVYSHADGIKSGAIKHYATGIMQGIVGPDADERVRILQELSLGTLKPTEVPSILDVGEVVLNPRQQATLIGNLRSAIGTSNSVANAAVRQTAQKQDITVTMGDVHVHEVNNGQEFAKAIVDGFKPKIIQEMSKINRW